MRTIEEIAKDLANRTDGALERIIRNQSGMYAERHIDAARLVLDRRRAASASTMTRAEAISAIMATWGAMDAEFTIGAEEAQESRRELREALLALGVTEAEMDGE